MILFKKDYGGRDKYFPFRTRKEEQSANDCAIRAVAIATSRDYMDVWNEMFEYGRQHGYLPNDDRVVDYMMDRAGFKKRSPMVDKFNEKYPLCLAPISEKGVFVFRQTGHWVAVVDSEYRDIFRSGGNKVFSYYSKKEDNE